LEECYEKGVYNLMKKNILFVFSGTGCASGLLGFPHIFLISDHFSFKYIYTLPDTFMLGVS